MKSYPIIFSGPMIHRLLDGSKTQTRRLTKRHQRMKNMLTGPWGKQVPGDLLWVRENFCDTALYAPVNKLRKNRVHYAADGKKAGWKYSPSIHMPRWAARLTLEVTDVRLQRSQEISHEDVLAEGVTADQAYDSVKAQRSYFVGEAYRNGYRNLWESLHGTSTWEDNPEVIALTFHVHHCNIDDLIKQKTA